MNKLLPIIAALALLAAPAFAQGSTEYCREFNTTVTIGGVKQPAWGTSCLQPDGSWQVINDGALQQTAAYNEDPLPYDEDDFVVVEEERPVFHRVRYHRPYVYPQTSLSFGYSNNDHWRHGRHWGSGVGVGVGRHW